MYSSAPFSIARTDFEAFKMCQRNSLTCANHIKLFQATLFLHRVVPEGSKVVHFARSKSPCGSGWDSEILSLETTFGLPQFNCLTGMCILWLDSWDGELNWARCGTCGRSRARPKGPAGLPPHVFLSLSCLSL